MSTELSQKINDVVQLCFLCHWLLLMAVYPLSEYLSWFGLPLKGRKVGSPQGHWTCLLPLNCHTTVLKLLPPAFFARASWCNAWKADPWAFPIVTCGIMSCAVGIHYSDAQTFNGVDTHSCSTFSIFHSAVTCPRQLCTGLDLWWCQGYHDLPNKRPEYLPTMCWKSSMDVGRLLAPCAGNVYWICWYFLPKLMTQRE